MSKAPKLNRRQFIASAGIASASLAMSGPKAALLKRRNGSQSSLKRDRHILSETVAHQSGVPLGGIGAGSVEIRPDGYFHDWLIFNMGSWAPDLPKEEQGNEPDMGPGALAFFLRTKRGNEEPQIRRLGIREDENDMYSLGWVKNVRALEYEGQFPMATLKYVDESLPIDIKAEFFGPFVAHDPQTSGTPGFHGIFTISNAASGPMEVSLMSCLRNPVAYGNEDRKLRNHIQSSEQSATVTMNTDCEGPRKSTLGSMAFSLSGGKPSWIIGDFEGFLSNGGWFHGAHYGNIHDTYLRRFRDEGALPNQNGATSPAQELMLSDEQIAALSSAEKDGLLEKLSQYASLNALIDHVKRVEANELNTDQGKTKLLQDLKRRLDHLAGRDRKRQTWGSSALCSSIELQPGETKSISFALSWYFPYHFSSEGPEMGHVYEQWFRDAAEVNHFLQTRRDQHADKVREFVANMGNTSLPHELASSWSEQLSTLTKCTWWTRAGRFGVWEGLGCCGFHTMDITYQGSFSILALFPDLQKTQMKMGSDYQRADGRVAHFFSPDLMHVDDSYDRVDMNPQFVMLACRDYLWTGDRDYLNRLFPHVQRAIANTAKLDANGDGLPDQQTRLNTFDNWNFFGTPSYISSLWLGGLLAGERLAREVGENGLADEWRGIYEKGRESFERLLWNGDYYSLWVDDNDRDECCMTDQLSGLWFSGLTGFESPLADNKVKQALTAICQNNFSHETGLVNATYPQGTKPKFSTYMNGQATANWTGVEYAFVSMLLMHGLDDKAHAIAHNIADRYRRAGRIWNHVECGDHYYRAMSSWSTLLAATGFAVDMPKGVVSVLPKKPVKAPWVSSTGWGLLDVAQDRLTVTCRSGSLAFSELRVPSGTRANGVRVNSASVAAKAEERAGYRALVLDKMLALSSGDVLKTP